MTMSMNLTRQTSGRVLDHEGGRWRVKAAEPTARRDADGRMLCLFLPIFVVSHESSALQKDHFSL